jgi:hypothetical protein
MGPVKEAEIEYVRGTTFQFTFNYTPPTGGADGATALFTVKTEIDNDITDLENDILVPKNVAMSGNTCNIEIAPGDVGMAHDPSGSYVWDLRVLDEDGKIYPCLAGKFKLDVTATNRITA